MTKSLGFTIRTAEPGDEPSILACLAEAFASYRECYTAEGYADTVLTPETLTRRMQHMSIFVAVTPAGKVIGTIGCGLVPVLRSPDDPTARSPDPVEGHLRGMAVADQWQGRGVAEQLLQRAESELRDRGCSRITLDTTLPLERAMRFYEKHGYQRSGRIEDFFGMEVVEYVKDVG